MTSVGSESESGQADSTGGPMATVLVACDPRDADPCDVGVCAGAGHSGYYCRPACSATAEVGDPCGAGDVCLGDQYSEQLGCFDVGDCDFLSGDPCSDADNCAVLTFDPLRTACVPSPGGSEGTMCGPAGALACDVGLGCLGTDVPGDDAGSCQQWCAPGQALPDGCGECVALSDALGTCSECSVLNQDCGPGQSCQPINELLGGVCVDFGAGAPGDVCDLTSGEANCEEGTLCLESDVEDVSTCVSTCDPMAPACPGEGRACVDLGFIVEGAETGLLGVCIEGANVFCDPGAVPTGCADAEICVEIDVGVGVCGADCDPTANGARCMGNLACVPVLPEGQFNGEPFFEGNGACGVGCSLDAECGGATCLLLDGVETDGICGTTCTPGVGAECLATQSCVATPGDPTVGACVTDGGLCDKAGLGGCATAAACIALDGGAAAVCVPYCFEQDPLACGGAPDNCQVKTEPQWHSGACLGGEACDPIAADCGPERTCEILGGSAVGGVAYTCEDAGPVAAGADCSASACVAGLSCVDDTCRELCDPLADACAAGSCTDIGASLYLPAGTLGACI